MSTQNKKPPKSSLSLTDEEMHHEIHYLRDRLNNLETFKRLFFELKQQNEKNIEGSPETTYEYEVVNPVIDFIHESASVANYQDLVMLFFNALLEYDLDVSVQLNSEQGDLSYKQDGKCNEKDIEQFSNIQDKAGVFKEEDMFGVNLDKMSLIIKGWADKSVGKTNEIEKVVVLLCEATNDKVRSIDKILSSSSEIENLQKIISSAYEVLSEIKLGVNEKVEKIDVLQGRIIKKASVVIAKLDLNEKQKKSVLSLLSSC